MTLQKIRDRVLRWPQRTMFYLVTPNFFSWHPKLLLSVPQISYLDTPVSFCVSPPKSHWSRTCESNHPKPLADPSRVYLSYLAGSGPAFYFSRPPYYVKSNCECPGSKDKGYCDICPKILLFCYKLNVYRVSLAHEAFANHQH